MKPPSEVATEGAGSGKLLLVVVAAACVVKMVVLIQLRSHPLLQPHGELDTTTYVELARRVAQSGPLAVTEPFFVSPLYVFFLAAIFAMGGSLDGARIVQVLLGACAVGFIWSTARLWFGQRVAWTAAALAIATGLFTFYEVLILQAALDPVLTASSLWLVSRLVIDRRPGTAAAAGACLALFTLNRPNVLPYALAVAGVLFTDSGVGRRIPVTRPPARGEARHRSTPSHELGLAGRPARQGWKPVAAFVAAMLTVLGANTARNWMASAEAVLVSSHGGLNFYIGNHEGARGTYERLPGVTPSIVGQMRDSTRIAEAALGRRLTAGEVSDYFYRQAAAWMIARPREALALQARKLAIVFNAVNVPLNYSYAYYSRDEPTLLRLLVVGPWLVLPLGLVGLCLPRMRVRRDGFWTLAAFVPIYAVSVAAFFVSSRYRMPLLVPLCMTAAAALAWIVDRLRDSLPDRAAAQPGSRRAGRVAMLPGLVAMGAIAMVAHQDLGLDDGRSGERTRKAVWLVEQGASEEAERYVASIAGDHSHPGVLRFKVGEALATTGKYEQAIAQYREALRIDDQPAIHLALGQTLVVSQRSGEAVPHLTMAVQRAERPEVSSVWLVRALSLSGEAARALATLTSLPDGLGESRFETAFDLGTLALDLDDAAQAARWLGMAVRLDPARADAQARYGIALLLQGKVGDALAPLESACRLDPSSVDSHLNLALAYARLGRPDQARAAADRALALDPDEPRARDLVRRLTSPR